MAPSTLVMLCCTLPVLLADAVRQAMEDSIAVESDHQRGCVDVNTAEYLELKRVPGFSRGLALRIVMGRTCFFQDTNDLSNKLRAKPNGEQLWAGLQPLLGGAVCIGCEGAAGRGQAVTATDVNVATADQLIAAGVPQASANAIVQVRACGYQTFEDFKERLEGPSYSGLDGGKVNFVADLAWFTSNKLCDLARRPEGTTTSKPVEVGSVDDKIREVAGKAPLVEADVAAVQFTEPAPVCKEQKLPHLTIPKMTFGDGPLMAKCDSGYSLSDHPLDTDFEVICDANGQVKGLDGKTCNPVDCKNPTEEFGGSDAVQGISGSTKFADGASVDLTCKPDYTLTGKEGGPQTLKIICQAEGTWTGAGQTCLKVVPETTSVPHSCPPGTSFDGKPCGATNCEQTLTCSKNGCTPEPLPCMPINCALPDLPEAKGRNIAPTGVTVLSFGQKVTFSCGNGFALEGIQGPMAVKERIFVCGENGRVTAEDGADLAQKVPSCLRKKCGDVKKAAWWRQNEKLYNALFKKVDVVSDRYGEGGAQLRCRFQSKPSRCFQKYIVDTSYKTVSILGKKAEITIKCSSDGLWVEPEPLEIQSCAYPLNPKRIGLRQGMASLLPSKEDGRVLTLPDETKSTQVTVVNFDPTNVKQYWVLDQFGLIRSAANPSRCLTAKTGLLALEGYLHVAACKDITTGGEPASGDLGHEWWLEAPLATSIRSYGGSCPTDESCCSLIFKAKSQAMFGYASGKAYTGVFYLTFPQAEGLVRDWAGTTYTWQTNGDVFEEWKDSENYDQYRRLGVRVSRSGKILQAPRSQQLLEDFYVQSEPFPKILKSFKMSKLDTKLSIVDFWK